MSKKFNLLGPQVLCKWVDNLRDKAERLSRGERFKLTQSFTELTHAVSDLIPSPLASTGSGVTREFRR